MTAGVRHREKLKNKTAVVTGASQGLGKNICIRFAESGIKVCGISRSRDKLIELEKKISKRGGIFIPIVSSVTDYEHIEKSIYALYKKWKRIDILVNNAGIGKWRVPLEEQTKESIDTVIDTNIKGTIYVTKSVVPFMKKARRGYIFNISSTAGIKINTENIIYGTSKYALDGFSDALNRYLLESNIHTVTLNPGGIDTPFLEKASFKRDDDTLTPDDITDLIMYILELPENILVKKVVLASINAKELKRV